MRHILYEPPMNSIATLPAALAAAIRSGQAIQTYAQAVAEVVANALDAGSTSVEITLDAGSLSFSVSDNGCGIEEGSILMVAQRHSTSKLRTLAELQGGVRSHGFRGEALSSLSEVSELTITSRAAASYETGCKVVCAGRCTQQGPAVRPMLMRGTVVEVSSMFFNQPVRRRQVFEQG